MAKGLGAATAVRATGAALTSTTTAPRNRGRRTAASAAVSRELILEASIHEFARHGFEGATTASVARVSGVTQPLVHYYFGTKDGLWRAAMEMLAARLNLVLNAAEEDAQNLDPADGLRVYVRRYVYFCAANPEFSRMIAREAASKGPRLDWVVEKVLRSFSNQLGMLIERVRAAGQLRDVRTEHVFLGLLGAASCVFDGAALADELYELDTFSRNEVQSFAETISTMFLDGIVSS